MSYQQSASFPGRRRPGALEHRPSSRNGLVEAEAYEASLYPSPRGGGEHIPYPAERTLGQIFGLLWRRKFLILASALVVGIVGYLISLQLSPRFLAQGVIAIETRPLYMPQLGTVVPPQPADLAMARSEAQILRSRELIETVSRRLKLDEDPDLNPYIREATFWDEIDRSIRSGIDTAIRFAGLKPEDGGSDTAQGDLVWAAVVNNVTKNLNVRTDGRSYVIYVEFESESPQISAAVVNTLMEMFITRQIESSTKSLVDANAWVKERATELKRDVDAADQKVQEYRSKHALVETRFGSVSSQQLGEMNTALMMARAERAQAEARYGRARDEAGRSGSGGTPDAASEVLASPLIQKLREREAELISREAEMSMRLGEGHPHRRALRHEITNLQSHIDKEINKILRSLQSQVAVAASRESTLDQQLRESQNRAVRTSGAEVELRSLEKDAETKRNVYQTFLATAQQTAEPSRINQANARIASSAVPPTTPFSPRKKWFLASGMFIGLLLAAAVVLLMAELDRGFETISELEEATGLPVLGAVPLLKRTAKGSALQREVVSRPNSAVSETIRGLRVALRSRSKRGTSQVVLVTSSEPGEGKTSLVSALGFLSARDGMRVLIVDSDLRRPRIHRLFRGSPAAAGGLQDVLRGNQAWIQAVRTDEDSGADYLTAYDRTDSPVALLGSGHWHEFLRQARRIYDLVILDSPPIMQVADALTLADYADTVVFVVGAKTTRRQTVQEALRRFAATGRPILGMVLSKVAGRVPVLQYYSGYAT
jgi:polysaccharide biosynthesis transport protein